MFPRSFSVNIDARSLRLLSSLLFTTLGPISYLFFKPVSAAPACLLNRADAGQPSVTLQSRRIDVFQCKVNTKQNNALFLEMYCCTVLELQCIGETCYYYYSLYVCNHSKTLE